MRANEFFSSLRGTRFAVRTRLASCRFNIKLQGLLCFHCFSISHLFLYPVVSFNVDSDMFSFVRMRVISASMDSRSMPGIISSVLSRFLVLYREILFVMSHPNSVHFSESLLLDEFSSMQDLRLFGLCLANHLLFNLVSFLDSLLLSGFSIFFCLNSSTLFVFHL